MEYPRVTISKPENNLEKLDAILEKLGITNTALKQHLTEDIKNHKNNYTIIDLLDKLSEQLCVKNTFENRYTIFCINRDLKQTGSPIHGENPLTYDDLYRLAEWVEVSREDIIEMHINLRHTQGRAGDYLNWYPTKRNIRIILSDLMSNDVIMSYAVEDLFTDILDDEEWNELLGPDDMIRVRKIR